MENILHNLPEEVTVLQMFQPIYLLIGALYLLIATGTRRLNCSPIRKEIHHHEKLFEALIGAAYITYAVHWSALWSRVDALLV